MAEISIDRVTAPGTRRSSEYLIWSVAFLICGDLITTWHPPTDLISRQVELPYIDVFHLFTWFVIARLLWHARTTGRRWDGFVWFAVAVLQFVPGPEMIWVGATAVALYLFVTGRQDPHLRAASILLAVLAAQSLWSRAIFYLIQSYLLQFDAAAIGLILSALGEGSFAGNIVSTHSGLNLIILPGCDAFHNISLGLLILLSVTKYYRLEGRRSDIVHMAWIIIGLVLLNLLRIYLMTFSEAAYHYWHLGQGADIYSGIATVFVVSVALFGVWDSNSGQGAVAASR